MRPRDEHNFRKIIERRDPRYHGRFYWGVIMNRIYCRPICPARPKPENFRIFKSSTEAEKAGYRPCLCCRPDLAPSSQRWEGAGVSVARALRLMDERAGEALSVADLSATRKVFAGIPGVGPWTVELIAMRCLGDADAFPRRDLIVQRAGAQDEDQWLSQQSYLTQLI